MTTDGYGFVPHAGGELLSELANWLELTAGLSNAMAGCGSVRKSWLGCGRVTHRGGHCWRCALSFGQGDGTCAEQAARPGRVMLDGVRVIDEIVSVERRMIPVRSWVQAPGSGRLRDAT